MTSTNFNMKNDKIKIIIDERENRIMGSHLDKFNCEKHVMTLNIGDFIISKDTVIERKTRDDFEQSIIDSRIFKQAQNMNENYNKKIMIIEGDSSKYRVSKNAVLATYSYLICEYGISFFFTKDKYSTCELIFSFAKHEQKEKKKK